MKCVPTSAHEDDSTYLCFGDLGLFLLNLLSLESRTSEESKTVEESFALLNEMGNSPDPEVVNIATVNVFEVLTDRREGIATTRQHLKGQAANEFERIVSRISLHV